MTWNLTAEILPPVIFGKEGEPPIVSEDVLVFFEGGDCQFEVANYDHECGTWQLVSHGFKEPDCEPSHWQYLPIAPVIKKPDLSSGLQLGGS